MAETDYNNLTKDELKTILDGKGTSYKSTDTKTELIKLLEDGE